MHVSGPFVCLTVTHSKWQWRRNDGMYKQNEFDGTTLYRQADDP